ncbi:unnamed protein product [Prorocentrum cordatum]|uniref:Uncharacterized protein n=1 Tax=Prorocentrum cordatum TaxID=2364126 RepID=A0ABN9SQC6_9DINO|nr:unnamed protein product [Polarella glacialis]
MLHARVHEEPPERLHELREPGIATAAPRAPSGRPKGALREEPPRDLPDVLHHRGLLHHQRRRLRRTRRGSTNSIVGPRVVEVDVAIGVRPGGRLRRLHEPQARPSSASIRRRALHVDNLFLLLLLLRRLARRAPLPPPPPLRGMRRGARVGSRCTSRPRTWRMRGAAISAVGRQRGSLGRPEQGSRDCGPRDGRDGAPRRATQHGAAHGRFHQGGGGEQTEEEEEEEEEEEGSRATPRGSLRQRRSSQADAEPPAALRPGRPRPIHHGASAARACRRAKGSDMGKKQPSVHARASRASQGLLQDPA